MPAHQSIVVGEALAPRRVPDLGRRLCGIDHVGHEHRHDRTRLRDWEGELGAVPGHVDEDHRLIINDPDVVTRRQVNNLSWSELVFVTVVHPDAKATLEDHLEVVDLAGRRSDQGLDVD